MKNRAVYLGLCWLVLGSTVFAQLGRIIGRTIYHDDKSRTESVSDPSTREMVECTYTPDNVMTVRKVFLLNERGEPLQGNVYDGRGNLVARCKCLFDEYGRRKEDQLINLNGEVFQQVIHEYDAGGKAKTPKVINLNASAPSIRPQSVDFTQAAAGSANAPASRFAPVQIPAAPTGAVAPTPPPAEEKPKPNFFKRLFQKKEK